MKKVWIELHFGMSNPRPAGGLALPISPLALSKKVSASSTSTEKGTLPSPCGKTSILFRFIRAKNDGRALSVNDRDRRQRLAYAFHFLYA